MRVDVKIPGGVESYCIDERGDKRVASDALWLETFLCGVLRAYAYADDGSGDSIKKIIGVRRFDPIMNTEVEHKFLEAAERLFFKGISVQQRLIGQWLIDLVLGWQLGSDPEIQVPNLVSNHLTTGLMSYIHTTGRYTSGINLFEKLRTRDMEVSSLLARVLISADEEVQAVKLLHDAIGELPMDYSLLNCQASFCQSKGRLDWALECAKRSVTAAPSEFGTWAKLAEIYVGLEQWDLALLTLNSCPMFTYQDKDAPRMPEPARVMLPILPDTTLDELDESSTTYDIDLVHPSLRKLHAASYKGTFLKAYSLLTEITSKIGWDQLLKIRSQVFVMEEEYRSEKQTSGPAQTSPDKNASTTALRGQSQSPGINGTHERTESNDASSNGETTLAEDSINGASEPTILDADRSIEKPEHTVTTSSTVAGADSPDPSHNTYTHFHNKRLCERWLDNLFMVLYEDLRIYTIWRTDMARSAADNSTPGSANSTYHKSAEEWEILGELAERLHHSEEAVEAYQHCLRVRFSPKAMRGVMVWHERQGKGGDVLQAMIRLIAWQYRWYSEVCFPFSLPPFEERPRQTRKSDTKQFSPDLLRTIRKLIENEGAVKVRSIVQATSLPQPVLELTHRYAEHCAVFRSSGSDG